MPGAADGDEMRQVQGQRLRRVSPEPDVGLPGGPGPDLPGVPVSGGGHRYAGCGASGAGAGQPGHRLSGGSGGAVPLMRSILFPELRQAVSGRGCALPSD